MRGLFQLLSVPASVIALIAVLGIAGGVERGTLSLTGGVCSFAVMAGIAVIGYIVYLAVGQNREEEDDEQGKAE